MPTAPAKEPSFIDDEFGQVDFRPDPEDRPLKESLAQLAAEHPEFGPKDEDNPNQDDMPPADEQPIAAEVVTPPAEVESEEPETIPVNGGGVITIEKTKKGWKATLDAQNGAPANVFYGRTKSEMFQNVTVGQVNAMKKIRDQNRELKLGKVQPTPAPTPAPAKAAGVRELTADEKFALKTQQGADPDLANQEWFRLKTGMTVDELVSQVHGAREDAKYTRAAVDIQTVSEEFVASTPEYFGNWQNFSAIVRFLSKANLGKNVEETQQAVTDANYDLYDGGFWTVENLKEAYDELLESGLIQTRPVPQEPAAVQPSATPAVVPQPPAAGRIVQQKRGLRAGLGLRSADTTDVPPAAADKPPSVEDLNALSDEEVSKLFAETTRLARSQRRSM